MEDRRFVSYLVVTNMALVVLALLGPVWCVTGLVGFVAVETVAVLRRRAAEAEAAVRVRRR